MRIEKRLFPYPVLADEKDDYQNTTFHVELDLSQEGINRDTVLSIRIQMKNEELLQMIRKGQAEFLVHMESPYTSYREVRRFCIPSFPVKIPSDKLLGKLEVAVMLVAKKEIPDFSNKDFAQEFEGLSFQIAKGSILGYRNFSFSITKDKADFQKTSSIFSVYKMVGNEADSLRIVLDDDKIKIGMNERDFQIYARHYNLPAFQPVLNTMIILPSLVYIFDQLGQEDKYDQYSDKEWFTALCRAYEKQGTTLWEELKESGKTTFELAQEAIKSPVSKGLSALSDLWGSLESAEEE